MSVNISRLSLVATAVMLIGFVVGVAEARADEQLTAHVPFAFTVGRARFAPGNYIVRFGGDTPNIVEVVSAERSAAAFVLTIPSDPPRNEEEQPALVFLKSGDDYVLSRVVTGDGEDRDLMQPRQRAEHPVRIALAR